MKWYENDLIWNHIQLFEKESNWKIIHQILSKLLILNFIKIDNLNGIKIFGL